MSAPIAAKLVGPADVRVDISGRRRHLGNVATAIRNGAFGSFNNATPYSFATIMSAERPFVAIRVILAHSTVDQAMTVDKVKFYRPAAPITNPSSRTGTHWDVTFGGSASVTLPALPTLVNGHNRIEIAVSDWLFVDSATSTEGAKLLPMMGARAYVSTPAGLTLVGNALYDMTEWSNPANGRIYRNMKDLGDKVTDPTTWTGNGAGTSAGGYSSGSPILGFQYMARDGLVATVMSCEDSIGWGAILDSGGTNIGWGSTNVDTGFYAKPCYELSDTGDIGIEYANMSWPSTYIQSQGHRIRSLLEAGIKPDLMFVMGGSPNNTAEPITQNVTDDMARDLARTLYDLRSADVSYAVRTMLASNPAIGVKAWGESDLTQRIQQTNARILAMVGRDVFDADKYTAGAVDQSGQVQLLYPDSQLHPTETSYAFARDAAKRLIKKYAMVTGGSVY